MIDAYLDIYVTDNNKKSHYSYIDTFVYFSTF